MEPDQYRRRIYPLSPIAAAEQVTAERKDNPDKPAYSRIWIISHNRFEVNAIPARQLPATLRSSTKDF